MTQWGLQVTPEEMKAKRKALGLTQREIAEQFGINMMTYWRWENGETTTFNGMVALSFEALEQRAKDKGKE